MILFANWLHKDATFTGAVPEPSSPTGGTAPFIEKQGLEVLQSLGFRGKQDNPSVKITPLDVCAAFRSHHAGGASAITVETRWDEKAGLRRDAVRSQVIDALEAQEIKETGNEED
jgi:hypothetical protein